MKVKRIAVYDKNAEALTQTARAVREYCRSYRMWGGETADISEYGASLAFLEACRDGPFDIAFVGANDMLDMSVAKRTREYSKNCLIFLVSDTLDYGAEGIRLCARDYLIKPVTREDIHAAAERAIENWEVSE